MSDQAEEAKPATQSQSSTEARATEDFRRRAEDAERELALRRAISGVEWLDADDAFHALAARAERDAEGKWWIVSAANPQSASRMTPAEAARELAARKPHWVKARVIGGSGAGSGEGSSAAASVTYAELLKPDNQEKLREFVHERPEELERLRAAHFGG